jgi:hypothetical protein
MHRQAARDAPALKVSLIEMLALPMGLRMLFSSQLIT